MLASTRITPPVDYGGRIEHGSCEFSGLGGGEVE